MQIKGDQLPNTEQLVNLLSPALVEAGQAFIAQNQMRASRGIGLDDAPMPRYANSTAKQKRKRGQESKVRTLTDTGSMLRSIHMESLSVEGSRAEIVIGFSNADDARKAAYNQARAPWFGASPQDQQVIQELLTARISQILEDV